MMQQLAALLCEAHGCACSGPLMIICLLIQKGERKKDASSMENATKGRQLHA